MTELGRVPWNLNFCVEGTGVSKLQNMELESCITLKVYGTDVLNDGTQFFGTLIVFGTDVLSDGTQFFGTLIVFGTSKSADFVDSR